MNCSRQEQQQFLLDTLSINLLTSLGNLRETIAEGNKATLVKVIETEGSKTPGFAAHHINNVGQGM